MDEREPPDDPVDFLRWYRDGWNDLDLDRILDAYATPCFVSRAGGCCTITTTRPRPGTSRTCWTATGARGRTAESWARSTCAAWAATGRWSASAGPAGDPTAPSSGSSPTPTCWRPRAAAGGSSATWCTNDGPTREEPRDHRRHRPGPCVEVAVASESDQRGLLGLDQGAAPPGGPAASRRPPRTAASRPPRPAAAGCPGRPGPPRSPRPGRGRSARPGSRRGRRRP